MLSLCAKFYAKLRMKIHEALFIMEAFDVVKNIILFPQEIQYFINCLMLHIFIFKSEKDFPDIKHSHDI